MRHLLFALSVIGTPALADDLSASIEVGRFGVMLDQVQAARNLVVADRAAADAADQSTKGIYKALVATVLRFNDVASHVCREVELPAADCTAPYMPDWLQAGAVDDPARLRTMIDDAGAHIVRFWGDMCDRAAAKDEHLCDIE